MILDRYILKIWLGPFLGGLILVLSVLMLGRSLKLLGSVSESGEVWSVIAQLLVLTLPYFLLLTVPMAFFLSMQNTITSLQQNSEMDALRASGVSYSRMFRSLLPMVCLLWLSLSYTSMVLMPQGQVEFYNVLSKVAAMKGMISFSPKRFSQAGDDISVYVDGEDADGVYHGVIFEDLRGGISVVYTSESARFDRLGDTLVLKMQNGVRLEGGGSDQRMLSFDEYQVTIPMQVGRWQKQKSTNHVGMMTPSELWAACQQHENHGAIAEWNRRILLPTTVLILFFFALPLSLTQKRSGKAGALIAGISFLVMVYNIQLMLHRQVGQGQLPGWSMWSAQLLMLGLGIYMWRRAESDRLPKLFTKLGELMYLVHQRFMHHVAHRWVKKEE